MGTARVRLGAGLLAAGLLAGCGAGAVPSQTGAGAAGAGGSGAAGGTPANATYAIDGSTSTASYTAHETFLDRNTPNAPVGKTSAITGNLVLVDGKFAPSTITVDLRTLKTDSAMRDRRIQTSPLETSKYPDAISTVIGAQGSAPPVTNGRNVSIHLAGTMTIRTTQKPMVFDTTVDLEGTTLHVTGSSGFNMSDFGLTPPNIANFIAVEEGVQLHVDLMAKKQ